MSKRKEQVETLIDSGAGFFTSATDSEIIASVASSNKQPRNTIADNIAAGEALPTCIECSCDLIESFLLDNFGITVCNSCRKNLDPKYRLMSRTHAKQQYLLKDCDFDKREPPLKYVLRRNPHRPSSTATGAKRALGSIGDMKLYLEMHVRDRAIEVFGTLEKIEEAKELRNEKARALHDKRFNAQLREMRRTIGAASGQTSKVRSGKSGRHVHSFVATSKEGEKKCSDCGQVIFVEQL